MLVDTSVWVDYFNGYPSPEVERLARAIADNEPITLPGIVWTEILLGIKTDAGANHIAGLLAVFETPQEPQRRDYIEAAKLFRLCRTKGYTVRSVVDCIIAQLCLRDGDELLSKDRDFKAIAKCTKLRLVELT